MLKKDLGFEHPENKSGKGGIRMFDNDSDEDSINYGKLHRRIYPDFYKKIEGKPNESFILDAKYKNLDGSLKRDDLYQVVTYMHTMRIDNGGFIYLTRADRGSDGLKCTKHLLAGYGGFVFRIGSPVPQNKSNFHEFKKAIEQYEKGLVKLIGGEMDTGRF